MYITYGSSDRDIDVVLVYWRYSCTLGHHIQHILNKKWYVHLLTSWCSRAREWSGECGHVGGELTWSDSSGGVTARVEVQIESARWTTRLYEVCSIEECVADRLPFPHLPFRPSTRLSLGHLRGRHHNSHILRCFCFFLVQINGNCLIYCYVHFIIY